MWLIPPLVLCYLSTRPDEIDPPAVVSVSASAPVDVPLTSSQLPHTRIESVDGATASLGYETAGPYPVDPTVLALEHPPVSARYDPTGHSSEAVPTRLTVASIEVDAARVVDVGVHETGWMEVPSHDRIGWYRHGAAPGQPGTAVLAGHIASDGEPGVFRHLSRVEIGDKAVVEMDDGRALAFVVTEIARYQKLQLPVHRIFSKVGAPTLVLISCEGRFDRALRSYSDNLVVYASLVS